MGAENILGNIYMVGNVEEGFTSDEEELVFAEEEEPVEEDSSNRVLPKEMWKILLVDDEVEIHNVTKLALSQITFEGKEFVFLSAYSGAEGKKLMKENPDVAVILLDVVMETDDAGLEVAKYVREDLKNTITRIVLRTGQPGLAPEEKVIVEYDINDYKEN